MSGESVPLATEGGELDVLPEVIGVRGLARAGRSSLVAVLLLLANQLASLANPLPTEEVWLGGRIVPASSAPVDLVSERLEVGITTLANRGGGDLPEEYRLCMAAVRADYTLRSDGPVAVPIVFPVVGSAAQLTFRLNARIVPFRLVREVDVFQSYEAAWREAINRDIAADERLRELEADAQRLMAAARRRQQERIEEARAAGYPGAEVPLETLHIHCRLREQIRRHRRASKHSNDYTFASQLATYMMGDWGPSYDSDTMRELYGSEVGIRGTLWTERELALSADRRAPDPIALWELPLVEPRFSSAILAGAELSLKAGHNQFSVSYQQPVAFVPGMHRGPDGSPDDWRYPVCRFRYVLRTARFWRKFGTIRIRVALPPGTSYAECSLPTARVGLSVRPPVVTYAGRGVPQRDLFVLFPVFQALGKDGDEARDSAPSPAPAEPRARPTPLPSSVEDQAPSMQLRGTWETVVTESSAHAHAPPAVDQSTVVCGAGAEGVICKRNNGALLGRFALRGDVEHLLLLEDVIVVGLSAWGGDRPRGYEYPALASVDRRSGRELWTTRLREGQYGQWSVRPVAAGPTVVGCSERGPVFAVHLDTGALLWDRDFRARALALSAEAAAGAPDGLVFYGGKPPWKHPTVSTAADESGRLVAARLHNGEVVWEHQVGEEVVSVACEVDKVYAVANGEGFRHASISCFRAGDGDLLWEQSVPGVGTFNRVWHFLMRGGRLLIVSDFGIFALHYGPPLRPAWTLHLGGQQRTPPVMIGDMLYMDTYKGLTKLDLASGTPLWTDREIGLNGPYNAHNGEVFSVQTIGGVMTAWTEAGAQTVGARQAEEVTAAQTQSGFTPPPVGQPPENLADVLAHAPARGWRPTPPISLYWKSFDPGAQSP